jgi:WhiB family redox-sensing transcriptional regulator
MHPTPSPDRPTTEATEAYVAVPTRNSWWIHARCNDGGGRHTSVFFSDLPADIAAAKAFCAACPVLESCLEGALERGEAFGVWGGQLFVDGVVVVRKRTRGRPRKVPRPEDQTPMLPIPSRLAAKYPWRVIDVAGFVGDAGSPSEPVPTAS